MMINTPTIDYYAHGTYLIMPHGHIALLGAFGLPQFLPAWAVLALTIPLTMVLTSLVGVTIERVAYRPLRRKGAHRLYVVITALMTGRYQHHVGGLECAIGTGNVGRYDDAIRMAARHDLGLPTSETTMVVISNCRVTLANVVSIACSDNPTRATPARPSNTGTAKSQMIPSSVAIFCK
jgi:branched-subunit amino acid ABC-type transport system permease component